MSRLKAAINKADAGEDLTESEQMLLDAKAIEMAITAAKQSDVGFGYEMGSTIGELVPMLLEMYINPAAGVGKSAQSKLLRFAMKRFGKTALVNSPRMLRFGLGTARVLGDITGAGIMTGTTSLGRTYADAMQREIGQIQYGPAQGGTIQYTGHSDGESAGKSFAKAYGAKTAEWVGLMAGGWFKPVEAAAGEAIANTTRKMGLGAVNDFMANLSDKEYMQILGDLGKRSGLMTDFSIKEGGNGTLNNVLGIKVGEAMNALTVGDITMDKDPDTGYFNFKRNLNTLLSFAALDGMMNVHKVLSYRTPKYQAKLDIDRASHAASLAFGDPKKWEVVKTGLLGGTLFRDLFAYRQGAQLLRDERARWRENGYYDGGDVPTDRWDELEKMLDDGRNGTGEAGVAYKALEDILTNKDYDAFQRRAALQYIMAVIRYESMVHGERMRSQRAPEPGVVDPQRRLEQGDDPLLSQGDDPLLLQAADEYEAGREQWQARQEGAEGAAQQVDATSDRMQTAIDQLVQAYGPDAEAIVDMVEQRPQYVIQTAKDDAQRAAAMAYLNAKAAMDGITDAANEQAEERRMQVEHDIRLRTYKMTGQLQPATLKAGDAEVFIIDGRISASQDGMGIDVDLSDDTIIVYNPESDSYEMMSPDQLLKLSDPVNAEQAIAEAQQQIDAELQASLQPSKYKRGEITLRGEDGQEHFALVTGDKDADGNIQVYISDGNGNAGHLEYFTEQQLDDLAVNYTPDEAQPAAESPADGTAPSAPEAPTEPVPAEPEVPPTQPEPQSALSRVPRSEKGEPLYEQADAATGWDALVEDMGSADAAKEVADAQVEQYEKRLKNITSNRKKLKGTPAEMKAQREQREALQHQTETTLEAWKKIAGEQERRRVAEDTQRQQEARKAAEEKAAAEQAERAAREQRELEELEALNGVPEMTVDRPADARARGYRRIGQQMVKRQGILQPIAIGKPIAIKFGSGDKDKPAGVIAIVDVDSLQPSHIQGKRNWHHFIPEVQPKDRVDAASVAAAQRIADNINPEEITSSVTAYTGAPTVNTHGEGIQGHSRLDALRLMYEKGGENAARYKQYLIDHAEQYGVDPEVIRQAKKPAKVNLVDVPDEEAIRLGQLSAQDTESGGVERIKPEATVQKLGDKMSNFVSMLLRGEDDEGFAQLVDRNGVDVIKWMARQGIISQTQAQSAFTTDGNLAPEAQNDLRDVLYQSIFQGAPTRAKEMFAKLPAKAQKAILSTAYRDYDSPAADRLLTELQNSITAYNDLMTDESFAASTDVQSALAAIRGWGRQLSLGDTEAQSVNPSEKYSNFALRLAALYRGEKQSSIQKVFNDLYDTIQGKGEDSLFGEADHTMHTLPEAIKKIFNIDYNGKTGSNLLGDAVPSVPEGRRGGDAANRGGGAVPQGEQPAEPAGRTDSVRRDGGSQADASQEGVDQTSARNSDAPQTHQVRYIDPREMSDDEKASRGRILSEAPAIEVAENQIVATPEMSARKAAEKWWDEHVGGPRTFQTEVGEVDIDRRSIESSLAHRYGQAKLDAITSLEQGFENAVYLGSMADFSNNGKTNHYFAYPINYNGKLNYVFCRAVQDNNQHRLYVHEVFVADQIKKGNTLDNAATTPRGGIALYKDILANVLGDLNGSTIQTAAREPHGLSTSPREQKPEVVTSNVSGGKDTNKSAEPQGVEGDLTQSSPAEAVHAAEQTVNTEPTDAQKEAGNYRKGHVRVAGYDITIENPAGSTRSGKDANGREWTQTMHNTYGYFRGTEGTDGDHIDVFLGDMDKWQGEGRNVYVVDQYNEDGTFDEHKVMMGFNSLEEAKAAYLSNYEEGWADRRRIDVTGVPAEEFDAWVKSSHRKTKAFAEYKSIKAETEPGTDYLTEEAYDKYEKQYVAEAKERYTRQADTDATPEILAGKSDEWLQQRIEAYEQDGYSLVDGEYLFDNFFSWDNYPTKEQLRWTADHAVERYVYLPRLYAEQVRRKTEDAFQAAKRVATQPIIPKKAKSVNLADYVAPKDEPHPSIRGVYYSGGKAYATDRVILVEEKQKYPKAYEGTVRGKDGNPVDIGQEHFPDPAKAFDIASQYVFAPVDVEEMRRNLARALEAQKAMGKKQQVAVEVASNGQVGYFDATRLKRFLDLVDTAEGDVKVEVGGRGYISLQAKGRRALLLGVGIDKEASCYVVRDEVVWRPNEPYRLDLSSRETLSYQLGNSTSLKPAERASLEYRLSLADNPVFTPRRDKKPAQLKAPAADQAADLTRTKEPQQLSQVTTSGRRLFEQVAQSLGVPTEELRSMTYDQVTAAFDKKHASKEEVMAFGRLNLLGNIHDALGDREATISNYTENTTDGVVTYDVTVDGVTKTLGYDISRNKFVDLTQSDGGDGLLFRMANDKNDFVQMRDEAVKSNGLVMPGLNEGHVRVVEVPRHEFTGTGKQALQAAEQWAKEHIVGEYSATDIAGVPFTYVITKDSVEKYVSSSATQKSENIGVHLAVLQKLPEVISNAVEVEVHASYKKGSDGVRSPQNGIEEDLLIHRFYSAVNIDGEMHRVKTTMIEHADQNSATQPHSYEVTKVEVLPELTENTSTTGALSLASSRGGTSREDILGTAKLLQGVEKSYDKGVKILDESKKSSETAQFSSDKEQNAQPTRFRRIGERDAQIIRGTTAEAEAHWQTPADRSIAFERTTQELEQVNTTFNEELERQAQGTLPKEHVYQLGHPGGVLQVAGVRDLPIRLSANRLALKASPDYRRNHPFDIRDIKNLPQALNHPIAVFDSATVEGSKVILTELQSNGNNFVVAMSVRRSSDGASIDAEINDIRSIYPKDYKKGIIDWVNRGYLKWVDKEKMKNFLSTQWSNYIEGEKEVDDLSTHRTHPGAGGEASEDPSARPSHPDANREVSDAAAKAELSDAAKVVEEFENPTVDGENSVQRQPNIDKSTDAVDKQSTVTDFAKSSGLSIKAVDDVTQLEEYKKADAATQEKMRRAKGWYDPRTGEIVVVLGNNADVADVKDTIFHETLGHRGLREMIGKERWGNFLDQVYQHMAQEVRERVAKVAMEMGGDFRAATEEYMSRLAEKLHEDMTPEERTIWGKVKAMVNLLLKKFFRNMNLPAWVELSDRELRWMMRYGWEKSEHNPINRNSEMPDMVKTARETVMRDETGMGNGEYHFRTGIDPDEDLQSIVTRSAVEMAAKHRDDLRLRNDAFAALTASLTGMRRAMVAQRRFDQATVKSMTDLAQDMLESNLLNAATNGEMKRVLSAVKNSVGKADIGAQVRTLFDILIKNQLREQKTSWEDLLSIKGSKVNAQGVEVQGKLDVKGQRMIKVLKDAIDMSDADLQDAIDKAASDMGESDRITSEDGTLRYDAYYYAKRYHETVRDSKTEEMMMRDDLEDAAREHKAGRMTDAAYEQFVEQVQSQIDQNRIDRADALRQLTYDLGAALQGSISAATAWRQADIVRVNEIQHMANADLEGLPAFVHTDPSTAAKIKNSKVVQMFANVLPTFESLLKLFSPKSATGEGYLYNYYMRKYVDSVETEHLGMKHSMQRLEDKAQEMFGMSWRKFGEAMRRMKLANGESTLTMTWWDAGGMRSYELTPSELLYIYMVNKMEDGKMKLRRMGIEEDHVTAVEQALPPKLVEFADWLQDEFFVEQRDRYNETYQRMFGASMAAVEHYAPIKIAKGAVEQTVDVANPGSTERRSSTTTGSIIKRTLNSKPLDLTHADVFNIVNEHVQNMEHWSAFSELSRDINTLLSYGRFRNKLRNMDSVLGSGELLLDRFTNAAAIATGNYRPKHTSDLDSVVVNIAKLVTTSKVAFRLYTAFKQLSSLPAFLPDSDFGSFVKSVATPWKSFQWALKELPMFEKRWCGRASGNEKMLPTELDWQWTHKKWVETITKWGLTPNAFVDAVTVAIGAKAVYDTRLKRYLRYGYEPDVAERRAKQDASILFNKTQQSSEGAFMSQTQLDRTFLSTSVTAYRNSPISYQRKALEAERNLAHRLRKDYKQSSIEYMKKQFMWDGLDEDRAQKAAVHEYHRALWNNVANVATCAFVMQLCWYVFGKAPSMVKDAVFSGGDDDKKKKDWEEMMLHAAIGGQVEGLAYGDLISDGLTSLAISDNLKDAAITTAKQLPATQDVERIASELGTNEYAALNDLLSTLIATSTGVNPQTLTDAVVAVYDACQGDMPMVQEVSLCLMRIAQVPQSQLKDVYFEELGCMGNEARKLSPQQVAERYVRYKFMQGEPFSHYLYPADVKAKREDKLRKQAEGKLKEQVQRLWSQEVNDAYVEAQETAKEMQLRHRDLRNQYGDAETDEQRAAINQQAAALARDPEYERAEVFKLLNKHLAELTNGYLSAKSGDEAGRYIDALSYYKPAMMEVVNAPDAATRTKLSQELSRWWGTFTAEGGKAAAK
jgi:hypothetical protein